MALTTEGVQLVVQNYKGGTLKWSLEVVALNEADKNWIKVSPLQGQVVSGKLKLNYIKCKD